MIDFLFSAEFLKRLNDRGSETLRRLWSVTWTVAMESRWRTIQGGTESQDRSSSDLALTWPAPNLHQITGRTAPNLHQITGRTASNQEYQITARTAPNLHQITGRTAPNLHQITARTAPNQHQITARTAPNQEDQRPISGLRCAAL